METQITATVTLTFDIPEGLNAEEQRARIEDDLGRLYDADSTTSIACVGFQIEEVKRPPTTRIHFLCAGCGSPDIRADAYASWDVEAGQWVMHSVYDDKSCEACGSGCSLMEVDEATGIEIEAFGMIAVEEGARLVEDHEKPDFYDLIVKTIPKEGGGTTDQTHVLHEFDNMTKEELPIRLAAMEQLYPMAGVECHLGAGA